MNARPNAKPLIGVYPGTFDPITNGHKDIIQRATTVVDDLVVGVASNAGKNPMFGVDQRVELVRASIADFNEENGHRVTVRAFDSLLMFFAREVHATCIVRGLRAVSDFEYEFQMAGMNARLDPAIETVFLMASETNQFISSRFVKEIAGLGGDITSFVSPTVAQHVRERLSSTANAP